MTQRKSSWTPPAQITGVLLWSGTADSAAAEGHELGSVPAEVVRRATSDVLIVQVPEDAESEFT